jgi:type IV pilus assembly protein PilC
MEVMLDRLSAYLDFKVRLDQKVRSALVYPVIVMLVAGAVIGFLVTFVLPTFADVFTQLNIDLPWPTRVLLASGGFVRQYWWAILLTLGAAGYALRAWVRAPRNAMRVDRMLLRIPLIGELARNIVLTRVLRTLGSLMESGVSILRSLELTQSAADNEVFRELLGKVGHDVKEGKVLSSSLAQGGALIPRVVIGMVATGERTGALPEIISRVAGFYEAETDAAVKNIFAAMEPLFIVVLGVMVGGIAVSVLLPMFDMASGIK